MANEYDDDSHGNDDERVAMTEQSLLPRWLPYERAIFEELHADDGLLVMGKGLGVHRVLACFMRLYCSPRSLVLCLNANESTAMLHQQLLALGLDRALLPRAIDAKSSANERTQLYKNGGCFIITSRILVVDILNKVIDAKMVTGMLVHDAHRVSETSIEAFIIRLYREHNRDGFVKAFSDETSSLAGGFNKMEQVLKHLFVRHAFLYPRFHVDINACLAAHQPDVYEIEVAFTPLMRAMQEAILVALEATIKELQRSTKALDASELTMQRALTKSFGTTIRRQLDPLWHKLPIKTKQLVNDLSTLRQLLAYLPRYDAISYYSFLLSHEQVSGQQRFPSPWLFTEAADKLLSAAKERLYQVVDRKTKRPINLRRAPTGAAAPTLESVELQFVLEGNPKWEALVQVLDEVAEERRKRAQDEPNVPHRSVYGGADILVMVKDDRTCAQLREFLSLGEREMMRKRFGHYLLQKEAALRKKGGALASLGLEQRLLLDAAKKFRANELTFETTATSSKASKATSKKRSHDDAALRLPKFSEASSFGMSVEELELITRARDEAARTSKLLRGEQDASGAASSSKTRATSALATPKLSLQLVDPMDQVVICTYEQAEQHGYGAGSLLQDLMPSCVVLYDPDVTFIRELEVFQATTRSGEHSAASLVLPPLEIYFMLYEESAEQQTYLSEIEKEKRAFDTLIRQKAHLMMPANVYDVPFHVKMQQAQQSEYSMDTRTGGRGGKATRTGVKVVVDVREFRSALPSMLHKDGLVVLPITLEVGDYILSPQICVERKSVSDLFGSLNSGRLFNQAENMRRFYQTPVLLIEFTQGKAFSLQDASEISSEILATNIISKLTLLVLHYPSLRIVWSRSPRATVDLFRVIKKNQDEPDMDAAAALGNGITGPSAGTGADATDADTRTSTGTGTGSYYNTASMDVLKKLPGVNEHNFRKVLASVESLAELSRLSLDDMAALIGKVCAKKLHAFFNTSL